MKILFHEVPEEMQDANPTYRHQASIYLENGVEEDLSEFTLLVAGYGQTQEEALANFHASLANFLKKIPDLEKLN